MNKYILFLFFATNFTFANDLVWSKTGHRVVGEVAQENLTKRATKEIAEILDGQTLADASTFGDEIKADSMYRKFSAWHYVNYPEDKKYGDEPPSTQGDLMTGIEKCIEMIEDENSTKADKAFYLKMLVHLIGDLHQPMHVGRLEDKGGNDIQVKWFNKGSDLHKVWDSNMIDDYGMSYTELASNLPHLSNIQKKAIQKGNIYDWVEESQDLANKVYGSVEMGEKLYYRYSYDWWNTVEIQLEKGGLRLAKVLNVLF